MRIQGEYKHWRYLKDDLAIDEEMFVIKTGGLEAGDETRAKENGDSLGREHGERGLGEGCPGGTASKESPSRWLRSEGIEGQREHAEGAYFYELMKKPEVKDIKLGSALYATFP